MAGGLYLPKSDEEVVCSVVRMEAGSRTKANRAKTRWLLTMCYMQGERDFASVNWDDGTVTTQHPIMPESFDFKYEGQLPYYQTELGRFMQLDFRPSVKRRGMGLDGLKKASIAQIVMNQAISQKKADALKSACLPLFLETGHVAFGAFVDKESTPRVELIPGWETRPVPADPVDHSSLEGLMRVRAVTREWLEERGLLKGDDTLFDWQEKPVGDIHNDKMTTSSTMGGLNTQPLTANPPYGLPTKVRSGEKSYGVPQTQKWTLFIELWVRDNDNMLREYVAVAGRNLIDRNNYEGSNVPMPVNVARYLSISGFYGRGFAEQFIEMNAQAEVMLDQLFQNVEAFDAYGLLCISTQMGLSVEEVVQKKLGHRVLMYNQDLYNPKGQPFNIAPANSGKIPLEITKTCLELMAHQASQSDILKGDAPGRVDNARGLSLLMETANMPLSGPTESLANALSCTYEHLLWLIRNQWEARKTVELTLDDDALVGIRYDAKTGQVTLEKDAVPDPSEVEVTIMSKAPRSEAQMGADLDDALAKGIITPREYRINTRKMGLKLPVGAEIEWQNYRRAMLENVVLYGDGQAPGNVVFDDNDMHEVHAEVLQAFMSRPEYYMASETVMRAFEKHLQRHQEGMGMYPENIPMPEEAAEMQMEALKFQPRMASQQSLTQAM